MEENMKNIGEAKEMPHLRTPMADLMDCLNKQGFTDEFMITENGLMSVNSKQILQPEDLEIVEFHRFEGISDPDDMAILFTVVTKSGLKGTVVDAFGIYGNQELMDFMNKVESKPIFSGSNEAIRECVLHL